MRIAVDVWCLDLAAAPAPLSADLASLSEDERARHAGYLVAGAALRFATARIALRRLLSRRQGCSPAQVQIATGEHGKPFAVGAPQLFFNVSHSDDLALIAFCDGFPVGVDVESGGWMLREAHFAATVCSTSELAWWRRNETIDASALLRLWVRKEAVLKARGVGLSHPVSDLDLGDPAESTGVHVGGVGSRVSWRDLALPRAAIGAVGIVTDLASAIDVTLRSGAS